MRRIAACLILSFVATALLGAFALAASHNGTNYVGKTGQKRAIRLRANAKLVRIKGFSIELRCHDGSQLIDLESGFEPSTLHRGRFRDTQYGSTDTVIYAGQVKGSKVTGTVKVRDRAGKVRCVSPKVKFTARGH